jgi:glycosyltransferase involved in cell wall biosynthesis
MRILWLTPWFPYPPDNGIRIRLFNLIRRLAPYHEITLLSFVRMVNPPAINVLREYCKVVETVPWQAYAPWHWRALVGLVSSRPRSLMDTYSRVMEDKVRQMGVGTPFDVVIASTQDVALYALGARARRRLLEEHNSMTGWMYEHYRRQRHPLKRARAALTFLKHQRFERWLYAQFDACTMVSEQDARATRELLGFQKPLAVIPNAVDLDYYRPTYQPHPNTLVFNGSLTYTANLEAMQFFAREIWPRIRAEIPEATLRITGQVSHRDPWAEGIILTGYLEDVRPAVGQAWGCVVPLRTGSGTRLKILEAMALGTPVVATTKGAEGLAVTHGEHLLIADEPAEFATQTITLLRDADLRARLAQRARQLIETRYNWAESGKLFNKFLGAQLELAVAKDVSR